MFLLSFEPRSCHVSLILLNLIIPGNTGRKAWNVDYIEGAKHATTELSQSESVNFFFFLYIFTEQQKLVVAA